MSAPRTKRQFAGAASDPHQRQITSFFERKLTSSSSGSPPADYTSGPLSPPLPGAVQANLLSVGMRVRKSVPEGYKTGHKFGSFQLWADNNTSPTSHSSPATTFPHHSSTGTLPSSGSQRELLPFCGINKVGGLAVQPETAPIPASYFTSSALVDSSKPPPPAISISPAVPELDDLPGLTSSQDSINSTTSSVDLPYLQAHASQLLDRTAGNSKKRLYVDDPSSLPVPVPPPNIIWRERRDWVDGQVSPRSLAPVGWEKNARVMAVPRGARKAAAVSAATATTMMTTDGDDSRGARLRDLGQENRLVAVAGGGDDFEEAEFLDYMELEEE